MTTETRFPIVKVHAPSLPCNYGNDGKCGRGWNVLLTVVRCTPQFKDFRSSKKTYEVIQSFGIVRIDHGMVRGRARKLYDAANALVAQESAKV
jgi:hypothetical protein